MKSKVATSFRELALLASEEEQEKIDATQKLYLKKRTENARKSFFEMAGFFPDSVDAPVVISGDVKLRALFTEFDDVFAWRVIQKCPQCGEDAESNDCWSLEAIGFQLSNFNPSYKHAHKEEIQADDETHADRLISALSAFLEQTMKEMETNE